MLRFISLVTIATTGSPVVLRTADAQVTHQAALSAGRAFMLDLDDPDPAGSCSLTGTLERRRASSAVSFGVEAGLHEYLILRQDLPPDATGWSSKLDDTRMSWRVTPFVRWGTGPAGIRLYGQVGMGLYVRQRSGFDRQHEDGVLVVNTQYASTDGGAGLHLGLGIELFPGEAPVGLALGLRGHAVLGGGDWFNTGELGLVYRWGDGSRR